MSIYADFYLYLQSKHDQNTTILLDRHGLEMLKMAWIVHVFLRDATTMANFRLVVTIRPYLSLQLRVKSLKKVGMG